jgi:hypothetical protein
VLNLFQGASSKDYRAATIMLALWNLAGYSVICHSAYPAAPTATDKKIALSLSVATDAISLSVSASHNT